jgi:cysteine desulfurase
VQAFLKVKLSPQTLGVDTLTVSAHKIHAPRGAAALYISPETVKKKNIAPVIPGGGQEMGMRSGTENLISIAAFAAAAEDGKERLTERMEKVLSLREYLNTRLHELEPLGIEVKTVKNSIPDIASLTLPRIKSETMLNFLSGKGICASAGSACSAGSGRLSNALRAFGCPDDVIDSSLRISLSYTNTEEDIDALCNALAEGAKTLQKF